jgi:hypothetical protein
MKRILPVLAVVIFVFASCSSDDGETTPSSSSSGPTMPSSSSNNITLSSSSDDVIGSCIADEVACYESIPKNECDEEDGEVFHSDPICDASVYSYCHANCEELSSSFTKNDCLDVSEERYGYVVFGLFVIPEACAE